jgi:hypothetical protein
MATSAFIGGHFEEMFGFDKAWDHKISPYRRPAYFALLHIDNVEPSVGESS